MEDTTLESINETAKMIPLLEKTSKELINKIIDSKYNRRELVKYNF